MEAGTTSAIFGRELPREPKVRASGPAEPSVASRHMSHTMQAGHFWVGGLHVAAPALYWDICCLRGCGFVKRALGEISGNTSLAPSMLFCYLGQAIEFS